MSNNFYTVRWFVSYDNDKYMVKGPNNEKYTFTTDWAANEMRRFCQALERQGFGEVTSVSLNGATTSNTMLGTTIKLGAKEVVRFDMNGNVIVFDVPAMIGFWFRTTGFYKNVVKLFQWDHKRFLNRLWKGWDNA